MAGAIAVETYFLKFEMEPFYLSLGFLRVKQASSLE